MVIEVDDTGEEVVMWPTKLMRLDGNDVMWPPKVTKLKGMS